MTRPIDVWNSTTFDAELVAMLEAQIDLIRSYLSTDQRIFLAHDLGREPRRSGLRPENPFASAFLSFEEALSEQMVSRSIRAFHYTRTTDCEASSLLRDGIHLSTPETLQRRLGALVATGELSRSMADSFYAQSPFHSEQLEGRADKFWMTSHPISIDDLGVTPLMKHWGGEVASMWVKNKANLASLSLIGRARIIEVAVPIRATRHSLSAASAVVATFARSRGCTPAKHAFDLYVKETLPSSAIIAMHTEGEQSFTAMGRGYPAGFVDVSIGYWKELTGEDG